MDHQRQQSTRIADPSESRGVIPFASLGIDGNIQIEPQWLGLVPDLNYLLNTIDIDHEEIKDEPRALSEPEDIPMEAIRLKRKIQHLKRYSKQRRFTRFDSQTSKHQRH